MASNGSTVRDRPDPKENKVRSMATQLLAKFENKPNYTIRKTQVETIHQYVSQWYVDFILFPEY